MERGHKSKDRHSIVFIHGFSATKESFTDVSKFLSMRYHIVSVDLPGHGMTSGKTPNDVGISYFVEEVKKVTNWHKTLFERSYNVVWTLWIDVETTFCASLITIDDPI